MQQRTKLAQMIDGEGTEWQEEHKRKVAQFPEDVRDAHVHGSNHRAEIEGSLSCGCFYCLSTFSPTTIVEWTDENEDGIGQTAVCPECGIDSVIGDNSGYPITREFLSEMQRHWF